MRLDFQASERGASVFLAFKKYAGLTDKAFSHRLGGAIAPSTLNRLLVTGRGLTLDHCRGLAAVVARGLSCSADEILLYIIEGEDACPPIQCLLAAQVFELKEECLAELETKLEAAERDTLHYQEIGVFPSPQFLTDPVRNRLCRWLACSFDQHVSHRYKLLKHFARGRANRFVFGVGDKPPRIDVFISRTNMDDFLCRVLPAMGCTPNDRDALVEFWIFDCLYNRNVHFGIFDSPPTSVAETPPSDPLPHDGVALFDRGVLLIRRHDVPGVLWIERSAANAPAAAVIDRYAAQCATAHGSLSYDLDSKCEVERQLAQLLSRRTWAHRSLNARMYRSANLN